MEIEENLIFLNQEFNNCEECVEFIGKQMENNNIATPQYTQAMLDVLTQYKGVIVLDEGFALAHARPEQGVLKDGLVFVQLNKPLDFYNEEFKEVKFVVGMASKSSDEHIETIQSLAKLIECEIQHQNFKTKKELIKFIEKYGV